VTGLLMYYLAEHRGLRQPVVVSVNNTSMAEHLGRHYGIEVFETSVGFKYIGPKMIETGAMMGGEESGGFGFGMHLPERDGIYADLLLLDLFLRELQPTPDTTVLDVGADELGFGEGGGCGTLNFFEERYPFPERITALGLHDGRGFAARYPDVRYVQGDACDLPFADGAFDVVVMQHIAMQIAEKDQLFDECARVLRGDGALALHEIFSGEGGPPLFPLAWATDPAMSSLETLDECTARLVRMGLQPGPFVDQSAEGQQHHLANIKAMQQALAQQEGALGLTVEATKVRLQTATSMERNLREGRLKVGMVVYRKTHK